MFINSGELIRFFPLAALPAPLAFVYYRRLETLAVVTSGLDMNKKELIEAVAEQADLPKSKAELAVNAFLHATQDALVRGEPVQLIGFGTFTVADRAARKGRNPQTGQEIEIPASRVPQFKAGAKLKESVNA